MLKHFHLVFLLAASSLMLVNCHHSENIDQGVVVFRINHDSQVEIDHYDIEIFNNRGRNVFINNSRFFKSNIELELPPGNYSVKVNSNSYFDLHSLDLKQFSGDTPFQVSSNSISNYELTLNETTSQDNVINIMDTPYSAVRNSNSASDKSINSNAFAEAINDLQTFGGGIILVPRGEFWIDEPIVLDEQISIVGYGRGSNSYEESSTITLYGPDAEGMPFKGAVVIDGERGTEQRRYINLKGFNIRVDNNVESALYANYLTHFNIENVNISFRSKYGMNFVNSFNGSIRSCKVEGKSWDHVDKAISIKIDTSNDVFSGQMLLEDVDIWNSKYGVYIENSTQNILAQLFFEKCHFKRNNYGVYIDGDKTKQTTFQACHFEGNYVRDLYASEKISSGPSLMNCYFNNGSAPVLIELYSQNSLLQNNEFERFTGDAIRVYGGQNQFTQNIFRPKYGLSNDVNGIILSQDTLANVICEYNLIEGNSFYKNNESHVFKPIIINSNALQTQIGYQYFDDALAYRVIDHSENTVYRDKLTLISDEIDLSDLDRRSEIPPLGQLYFILNVQLLYTTDVASNETVLRLGKSSGENLESLGAYFSYDLESAGKYYTKTIDVENGGYVGPNDVIILSAGSGGTGRVQVKIDLVPYKI